MLPKPTKAKKKKYFPAISTPQPLPNQTNIQEEKIENLIMKLLEKSRKKVNSMKHSDTYRLGNRTLTKIPFLNYKLNLPRSLNTLKSPKHIKFRLRSTDFQAPIENFTYRLTGTSLFNTRYG